MVKLKRIYESKLFMESDKDKEDLKKYLGNDLYNDYMKIRDRIPKDQNDYKDFQKLKKLPIEDVKDFVGSFQSETDKRKEPHLFSEAPKISKSSPRKDNRGLKQVTRM